MSSTTMTIHPTPMMRCSTTALKNKPQAILLSLQNIGLKSDLGRWPTPDAIERVSHELHIPTVEFWFDIQKDWTAGLLERYQDSVTLNVILGADVSSHRTLSLYNTNDIYAGVAFDERLFDIPDGQRNISVGFLGNIYLNRDWWIARLRKSGITILTAAGEIVNGRRLFSASDTSPRVWIPYKEYCEFMSRLKIALNFSAYAGVAQLHGWLMVQWLGLRAREWALAVMRNPSKAKLVIRGLRNIAGELSVEPRYMVRGRVWEALWCRTFLLEEDNPVTSVYFEPYVDYVPFTTLKDLVEKVRYYLENDDERNRIRLHGRATVEKYYNARLFCENLFEAIGLLPARREHNPGEIWNKAYFDKWYLSNPPVQTA